MIAPVILLLSLLGIFINISMAGSWVLPDWSAALLLAAILAHRGNWIWVIPAFWVHDLSLHWSATVCLPFVILLPILLAHIDMRIGPALPQRVVLMLVATMPLLLSGWGFVAWLLTLSLCTCIWYILSDFYAQPA